MRQIKFRGLRTDGKGWVYGFYYATRKCTDDPLDIHVIVEDDGSNSWRHEVIPESVGQFTGLTDKNGIEIYEGDILNVKTTFENNMADRRFQEHTEVVVGFDSGCFIDTNSNRLMSHKIFCIVHRKVDHEIISNIHQNTELCQKP